MTRRRLVPTLLIALVASLALAASAQASSIVFIKRGDVWLAKADGSAQRALTRDGTPRNPYRSPAYSNKGVITAIKGRRDIHFFNRRGRRTRKKLTLTRANPAYDPVAIDHSTSPDGRWLASTLWLTTRAANPRPDEPQGTDYGTMVLYWNARTRRLHSGGGVTNGGQSATWVTNSTPVVFAPYVYHSADAWVVSLGNPNSPRQWFQDRAVVDVLDPSDGEPLDDGEVTRRQDKIAVVRGPNTTASSTPTMIRVYAVSNLVARPTERCDLRSFPNSRIESLSWSPDGKRLVWSERSGIWVSPISDGSGADCGAAPKKLISGGSQPDWGPANAPRKRRR